ncbi:MAG: EAL domain-containing protein [Acidimicrobiales bacterium]
MVSGDDAEAARFWRRVVRRALDPIFVLDGSHRCLFVSDQVLVETGFTREELVGRRFESLVVDADGSSITERLDRSALDGTTEFGVTIRTVSGRPTHTRAVLRCELVDERPRHVVSLHPTAAGTSAESALRRRVELEKLLERIQNRFIHAVPTAIGDVIQWALAEVGEFLGADRSYVLEFDHAASTETMIHEWARPGIEPELGVYENVSWDLAPAASRRNNALWVSAVPDVSKLEGEWELDRTFFEESGLKSILELPIIIDGRPVGGLGFDWLTHLADWTEDDLTLLGMFASTFAQLLGRDAAERELVRRSTHDELTGLPNRAGVLSKLRNALDSAARGNGIVGVLVIDVDQFKVVNDSLGNQAGDDLLRLVGARLRGLVRPADVVGRLGGDEFAVVLVDAPDDWTVSQTATRLREGLAAAPYRFGERSHRLTVSCGIAGSDDGSGNAVGADELLRRAGAAMYRAKELGRARQSTFDVELERRIAERLQLDQQLRAAKTQGEFEVHFQPEVELSTGRMLGAEALLRWRTDGVLRPACDFIEVVEETGLIVEVGRWVLDEACRAAARWCSQPGREDFVIRVNLSPRQLEDPNLVEEVRATLARHGLPAERLCLEITETALMGNAEAALGLLHRLDALGVDLAIDDFGTGYSSLSYLKRFPVDILKIDRSFVDGLPTDPEDMAIVATIVHLAESLGMTVTAEGIESSDQAVALTALGCDRGQGWLYSKAVTAAAIDEMLAGVAVSLG